MENGEAKLGARYAALLADYLRKDEDAAVESLQALSGEFVRRHLNPEDVVALHDEAISALLAAAPVAQAPPLMHRSLQFLRLAMRGFGMDPLRPFLETTVTNRFVGQILRELEVEYHLPDVSRVRIGRRYADNFEGDLTNYLDMFRLQGLGQIALESVNEAHGEVVFTGQEIFESFEESEYPQDHFTRGFLARAVSVLTDRPMNCEEVACQAQGATVCRFVVTPVEPGPIPDLRRLLEG